MGTKPLDEIGCPQRIERRAKAGSFAGREFRRARHADRRERGFERGDGEFVHAQRAEERIAANAFDDDFFFSGDDSRLRAAQQFIAAERHHVPPASQLRARAVRRFRWRRDRQGSRSRDLRTREIEGGGRARRVLRGMGRSVKPVMRKLEGCTRSSRRGAFVDGAFVIGGCACDWWCRLRGACAPLSAMMSGMRKPSPISISSPRETMTSAPLARVLRTRKTAAALLLTTMAASAPASSARRAAGVDVALAAVASLEDRTRDLNSA